VNKRQRIVLCCAAVLILAMLLFPPWVSGRGTLERYGCVFIAQSTEVSLGYTVHLPLRIDWQRLALQVLAVALPAGVLMFLLSDRARPSDPGR
jgi:hypothetical protein